MTVIDLDTDQTIGRLLNITTDGLMLLSVIPIELEKLYRFEINLSSAIDGHSVLRLGADSLWSNPLNDDKNFWTGFQIIDISEQNKKIIQHLVDDL